MTKSKLRKLYLEKRSALSPTEVATASGRIADRFLETIVLPPGCVVHTFIRIGRFNEIDTSVIYYRLWKDRPDIGTAAPRTDLRTGEIASVSFHGNSGLAENSWGIREPANGDVIEPSDIDVVIVPLLCFDDSGQRVGYGKGIYDRFLAACRPDCIKAGVSLFPPVDKIEGITSSDVALDMCITPEASFQFETARSVRPLSTARPRH